MTDTNAAMKKLKASLARTNKGQYYLSMADSLIDGLVLHLDGADDSETAISEYYTEVTGEEPYLRPSYGLLPAKARIILMARDMLNGKEPKKRYMFKNEARRSVSYTSILWAYEAWLTASKMSASTIMTRVQRSNTLFLYLESVNITSLEQFNATNLAEFIAWLDGRYTSAGKMNILYTLRNLFICPDMSNELMFKPMGLLTNLHTPKHNTIPPVYAKEEVGTLLDSLDQSTDSGRMLYLIVAMASVYGLRSGDIRELRLKDIDWTRKLITVVQHKTGSPLQLPLTEGIELALLDYIMNTRPESTYENILIKHRGCAEPYSCQNHFSEKMRTALIACGIELRGRKAGLHSLRHSLATGMLASGVPLNEIAAVLGHRSIQSTAAYIWADVEHLRVAALGVDR